VAAFGVASTDPAQLPPGGRIQDGHRVGPRIGCEQPAGGRVEGMWPTTWCAWLTAQVMLSMIGSSDRMVSQAPRRRLT
jgi:hypothetical protein